MVISFGDLNLIQLIIKTIKKHYNYVFYKEHKVGGYPKLSLDSLMHAYLIFLLPSLPI